MCSGPQKRRLTSSLTGKRSHLWTQLFRSKADVFEFHKIGVQGELYNASLSETGVGGTKF